MPVECPQHLEAGVSGARGEFRVPGGALVLQACRDVLLAAVGEDEGFCHVQVATVVGDADHQRVVAILRDLRPCEPVLLDQEPEPSGCLGHEGLAADVHEFRMPQTQAGLETLVPLTVCLCGQLLAGDDVGVQEMDWRADQGSCRWRSCPGSGAGPGPWARQRR
jgi:hypothetical protein